MSDINNYFKNNYYLILNTIKKYHMLQSEDHFDVMNELYLYLYDKEITKTLIQENTLPKYIIPILLSNNLKNYTHGKCLRNGFKNEMVTFECVNKGINLSVDIEEVVYEIEIYDVITPEEIIEMSKKLFKEEDIFKQKLWYDYFFNKLNYNSIKNKYNIPLTAVWLYVKFINDEIKNKIKTDHEEFFKGNL